MAGRTAAERGDVASALNVALTATKHEKRDGAAVALAVKLAGQVDAAGDAKTVGELAPKLLAVLAALGMTPAARAPQVASRPAGGVTDGAAGGPVVSSPAAQLDAFRERARARRAPAVDSAAP